LLGSARSPERDRKADRELQCAFTTGFGERLEPAAAIFIVAIDSRAP
jgi:hypothetical protein